jgi:Family of unknown function (DUF5372)
MARSAPAATWRSSWRNAPSLSADLGFATITHPFHPRNGQRCLVLEAHQSAGVDRIVLRTPEGLTIMVPVEWTDRSLAPDDCGTGAVSRFDVISLLKVVEIARRILGPTR